MVNKFKRRWLLCLLMFGGILINYIDRVNLSHVIIPMAEELDLNPIQQGILLSSFSWGYVGFMLIGGILVDRVGPRKMAGVAAAFWSIATCWTGLANSFFSSLGSRIALGAAEAPIFPANARLVKENFPLDERGRATALFDSGAYVGTAMAAPLIVLISIQFGWRVSFIVCGVLGLLWTLIWIRYSKRLSNQNVQSADNKLASNGISRKQFFLLLKNKKILGASYGFFCYNYAKSFYLTWFPAYLITQKGYSFLSVGFAGAIPPLFAVVGGLAAGTATDVMIKKGVSLTVARKLPLCIGLLLSSTIVLAEYVDSQVAIIGILSFAFAATISASPGIWSIPGDIAPDDTMIGTIGGLQNTFSNLAGIVAPILTGVLFSIYDTFVYALLLTSIISISGALSYWFIVGELTPIKLEQSYDYEVEKV